MSGQVSGDAGQTLAAAPKSAKWQFRSKISWTPLRDWHPAFVRSWWIGGQVGKYANDAYTIGFRVCGVFVAIWWFLPNETTV